MAGGGFFGGLYEGAMGVQNLLLRQREADIREKLSDQNEYEFNQKKDLKGLMQGISDQQTQAEADNATAQQNADAAMAANQAGVAQNGSTAPGAPIIRDDGTPALNDDGTPALQTTQTAPADPKAIAKAYGLKAPVSIQYDYNQQRVAALQKSGDWKGAQTLRQEANSNLAGAVMGAYAARDERTLADLYNKFPNGHSIGSLHIAAKDGEGSASAKAGDIIYQSANADGSNGAPTVMSQFEFIQGVAAQMNPDESFKLRNSKMALDAQNAYHNALIGSRERIAGGHDDTKLVTNANTVAGGLEKTAMTIGGKGGASGTRAGSSGAAGAAHDSLAALVKLDMESKDANLFSKLGGAEGKSLVQVAPSAVLNSSRALLDSIVNSNPGMSQNDAVRYAYATAKSDAGLPSDFKKNVTLDPVTGAANVDVGMQGIGPDGKSPAWIKQANLYKNIDQSQIMNYGVAPDSLKAARAEWVQSHYGDNPSAIQAYAQVAGGDKALREKLIQAQVQKGYAPDIAAQIVDNSARNVGAVRAEKAPDGAKPSFTAQQLSDASSRGIKPPTPAQSPVSAVGEAASGIKRFVASGIKGINADAYDNAIKLWRGGRHDWQVAASIAGAAKRNPDVLNDMTPQERNDIAVASGTPF